jgi:hypothetical protein
MRQETRDGEESKGGAFEQIRREYEFGIGTVKGVARKLEFTAEWFSGTGECRAA